MNDTLMNIPAAVTWCDAEGKILSMNPESIRSFKEDGGADLVGKSIFGCHSPVSVETIKDLITGGKTNIYFVEKAEKRKLVYQAPWYETRKDGSRRVGGLVEISFQVPKDIRNIVRG
jgi:hypothetical protein